MLRLDLHVHTIRSKCSLNSLSYVSKVAKLSDFLFAVTDHNLLTSVKNTIPGEEIKTNQGEVIGIYLNEQIKPWHDVFETIDQIHDQGGFAILAHPFDKIRKHAAKHPSKQLIKAVDFVEFNARSFKPFIVKTQNVIHRFNKPFTVGSDSHLPWELGRSYLTLNSDVVKEDLINDPHLLKHEIIKANKNNENVVLLKSDIERFTNMLISGISSKTRRFFKL